MIPLPNEAAVATFASTNGAVSLCEGAAIFWVVATHDLPDGHICDLGSHAGKSSCLAVRGIANNMAGRTLLKNHVVFNMVDPCYDTKNLEIWKQTVQVAPDKVPWSYIHEPDFRDKVSKKINDLGMGLVKCQLVGDISTHYLPEVKGNFAYVFIDSDDHQPELVDWEVRHLEDRMAHGGLILFHDYKNQYHGPKEAAEYLVRTGKYREIEIPWDLIKKELPQYGLTEKDNNSWHMPGHDFPCFVGALIKK